MRRGRGKKGLIFSWAFYLSNHHALKWIIFEAYSRAFIMCDLEFSSSVVISRLLATLKTSKHSFKVNLAKYVATYNLNAIHSAS